ncbi:MAG: hypothetical protein R3Y28_05975 [Candidatus Gastranaerophilales bacterium]
MYEKLKEEKVILDITNLVENYNNFREDLIDGYCDFMKEVMLSTSGIN